MDDQQESSKKPQDLEQNVASTRDQFDEFEDDDGWGDKSDSNSNISNSTGSKPSSKNPSHHTNSNEQLNIGKVQFQQLLTELEEKNTQLEAENDYLKRKLESQRVATNIETSNVPPEVLKFFEEHKDEITLDLLVKAHDAWKKLKAINLEGDFGEYLKDISDHLKEIENLKQAKKMVEKKLQLMKKCYENELTSFSQTKVDSIFKNSGGQDFLDGIKKRDKINSDTIKLLRDELEHERKQVADLRDKNIKLEKKNREYSKNMRAAQDRSNQLEAELRRSANLENNHMGRMGSGSSFAEAPPPPPFDADILYEIQGVFPTKQQIPPPPNSSNNLSMDNANSSPPPPPRDIHVPMSEILESVRSHLNVRDDNK